MYWLASGTLVTFICSESQTTFLPVRTARLPRIEVRRPKSAIGRTTVSSMQSGLFHGYVGLVRNIIAQISTELAARPTVVATGGLAGLVAGEIPEIAHCEPDLVLQGLRLIYEKNRTGDRVRK